MNRAHHLASLFESVEDIATEALDTIDAWGLPDSGAVGTLRGMSRSLATLGSTAAGACNDEAERFPVEADLARRGGYIMTASQRRFWPLDPRPAEVHLYDIAHALAHKGRFGCHAQRLYTVGEHTLGVANVAREFARRQGVDQDITWAHAIVHDAEEAYLPDIPRPIKRFLPGWPRVAARVQDAILEAIGLGPPPAEVYEIVQRADDIMLVIEARALWDGFDKTAWEGGLPNVIVPDWCGPGSLASAMPDDLRGTLLAALEKIKASVARVGFAEGEEPPLIAKSGQSKLPGDVTWREEVKEVRGGGVCKVCKASDADPVLGLCSGCMS